MNDLQAAAELVMQYERWRDANPADRLDPALGPQIQIDPFDWMARAAAVLTQILEREDGDPFAAASTAIAKPESAA